MNEKALIKKCQRGDKQAFEELIRLYYDYVSGFLYVFREQRQQGGGYFSWQCSPGCFTKQYCNFSVLYGNFIIAPNLGIDHD